MWSPRSYDAPSRVARSTRPSGRSRATHVPALRNLRELRSAALVAPCAAPGPCHGEPTGGITVVELRPYFDPRARSASAPKPQYFMHLDVEDSGTVDGSRPPLAAQWFAGGLGGSGTGPPARENCSSRGRNQSSTHAAESAEPMVGLSLRDAKALRVPRVSAATITIRPLFEYLLELTHGSQARTPSRSVSSSSPFVVHPTTNGLMP